MLDGTIRLILAIEQMHDQFVALKKKLRHLTEKDKRIMESLKNGADARSGESGFGLGYSH